jgi:hypothetical protein
VKRQLPLVVATDLVAAVAGMRLVDRGEAYAVVYIEDGPRGTIEIRTWIGPGHEHRRAELDKILAGVIARTGGVVMDPGRVGARGQA